MLHCHAKVMAAIKVNFADVLSCSPVQSIKIQCNSGEPVAKKNCHVLFKTIFVFYTVGWVVILW